MKHYFILLLACTAILLASCSERNTPSYADGKDLSVNGHSYFMLIQTSGVPDSTFVAFDNGTFYTSLGYAALYSHAVGTYTQEKEVIKVEQNTGMLPTRLFISYGDFLLCQGVYYQQYK